MEEASVAGESPDRSKQRESSEEPTSGSAGPVPEARTEASETRDPRLAVTREAAKSSASAAAAESRGGVDTATRVLSVRDAAPGTGSAPEPEARPDAGDAGDADAEGTDEGSDAGTPADGRLRDVVAAWVTSAEERAASRAAGQAAATKAEEADRAKDDAGDEDEPEAGQRAAQETETSSGAPGHTDAAQEPADADADTPEDAGEPEAAEAPEAAGTARDSADDADDAPAEDDEPEPGAGPKAERDAADASDAAADRTGVDQPTTVFKAVRPSAPAVDQPTTMLKLGGAVAEAAKKAEQAKKTEQADKSSKADKTDKADRPEADSERTSKFVALKDFDDPASRKPQRPDADKPAAPAAPAAPASGATTALPRIRTGVTENYAQAGPERTTQQPLPPKPPLDLLAELTNTPPPPETPLRTTVRRVKIWTPLVILLAIIFAVVQAVRPLPSPTLTLTGKASYTFDGDQLQLPWPGEGQGWIDADGVGTMGNFGEQKPVAIGSVAKTMTAYIILRDHPLKPGEEGPKIEIDATAEKEGGYYKDGESTLDTVKAGDTLTEKQALSAVMIPSANNIARLLARWDAGSEAAFVEKMNATAKELGMTDTNYTDPSGLKETTVSTAEDQVKLGRAAVKIPAMVAITSAASWTDPSGKYWTNYNELPYRIGAIGIKTGSTTAAGGNLLFASRKEVDGQTVTVVGAILGQHKPKILETANAVSKTALLAAEEALTSSEILKKGDVVGYVDDQLGGRTPVVVTKDVSAVGWAGLKVKLSLAPGSVPHTAKAGTEVGTLTVGDGTSSAVKVPVALQEDLAEPGFTSKLTRMG
ncbi:D-alanyl-D-alanine carboxypeptidase [Streptomyces sp. NPDC052309]|uniref:D-alanyl-D-alanine carboxypeptidase n=1 Tax=Streptomyces sp. NPDC052309 TaxID=3155421 RepID=UPI00342A0DBC